MTKNTKVLSFEGAGIATGSLVCFLRQPLPFRRVGRGRLAAFTLVELLTVGVIMTLLLAATLPAMRGWRDSHARSTAVGQVMAVLNEARSVALAQGRPTYFVLSDHSGSWNAMAVYQQPEDAALPPEQLTPWVALPAGCHFQNPEHEPSLFAAPAHPRAPAFPRIGSDAPLSLPYLAFGESGRLLHPTRSAHARLLLQTIPQNAPDQIAVALFTGRAVCER